jgi:hypothetical protein
MFALTRAGIELHHAVKPGATERATVFHARNSRSENNIIRRSGAAGVRAISARGSQSSARECALGRVLPVFPRSGVDFVVRFARKRGVISQIAVCGRLPTSDNPGRKRGTNVRLWLLHCARLRA